MTNNEILKADLLDILFDNRNKAYGAYLLRKTYPQRLLFATGFTALFASGLFLFLSMQAKDDGFVSVEDPGGVFLTEFILPPPDAPRPPAAVQPPAPSRPVATSQFTGRIEIVKDQLIDESVVPPIEALANTAIGTENIEGAPFENNHQAAGTNGGAGQASEVPAALAAEEVFENAAVEQMAEFPGGAGAFQRYLARQLAQPEGLEAGETKTVKVRFVIEKDGSIDKITLEQSGGAELDRAVMKVLKKAPRWKPAVHRGRAVAVVFSLPVTFVGAEE